MVDGVRVEVRSWDWYLRMFISLVFVSYLVWVRNVFFVSILVYLFFF